MGFLAFELMHRRVAAERQESDSAAFMALLCFGEMLIKTVTAGMVAAIPDERDRHRYRCAHKLVRTTGLGDWVEVLWGLCTGPAAQHLGTTALAQRNQLAAKSTDSATWQSGALSRLHAAMRAIAIPVGPQTSRVPVLQWMSDFVHLRNKTRGHGAQRSGKLGAAARDLADSLHELEAHLLLLQSPWAYLHRNLSGKYRVAPLCGDPSVFDPFKSSRDISVENGIYISVDQPRLVELISSDPDASDFFYPNGAFTDKSYEVISYITGNTDTRDSAPYLTPASQLPASHTHGLGSLGVIGECFTNTPSLPEGYIPRRELEAVLAQELQLPRHLIVTLAGPGGIGKTSLALRVIHDLLQKTESRYAVVLWFSARDIDLLPEGPKVVRPGGITLQDFARHFRRLVGDSGSSSAARDPLGAFSAALGSYAVGPVLFVFDNFETVANPGEVYEWLDTYIREPNKVLITSRLRAEFRGDYPLRIGGMTEAECRYLIGATTRRLGIDSLMTDAYVEEVIRESEGHPYVIRILLGAVARTRSVHKIERIVANQEDILRALFERTYASLSPAAKRVFLTLANWRSTVPELAVEAVLLSPKNTERIDVRAALDELIHTSFVEEIRSPEDNEPFVRVPLAASVFGKTRLRVSEWRPAVEADTELLQAFGAAQKTDVRHGIEPRLQRLFRSTAEAVATGRQQLVDVAPTLEFVARKYPAGWLMLADLYEEAGDSDASVRVTECLERYLMNPQGPVSPSRVWHRIADVARTAGDAKRELHALAEMCKTDGLPVHVLSEAANRVNNLLRLEHARGLDRADRQALVQEIAETLRKRAESLDANACSRLAWLYLNLGNTTRALECAELGLERDTGNYHCESLLLKLRGMVS